MTIAPTIEDPAAHHIPPRGRRLARMDPPRALADRDLRSLEATYAQVARADEPETLARALAALAHEMDVLLRAEIAERRRPPA